MQFCGTESYVKKKSIVISCIIVSGMYKTMILISNRIDFGIFQTFALNSFLHTGILHKQRVSSQFVKIFITDLISL